MINYKNVNSDQTGWELRFKLDTHYERNWTVFVFKIERVFRDFSCFDT
ncbi:MAG: hypothetical protein ACP5PO_03355 [Desulfurella sp.]